MILKKPRNGEFLKLNRDHKSGHGVEEVSAAAIDDDKPVHVQNVC